MRYVIFKFHGYPLSRKSISIHRVTAITPPRQSDIQIIYHTVGTWNDAYTIYYKKHPVGIMVSYLNFMAVRDLQCWT